VGNNRPTGYQLRCDGHGVTCHPGAIHCFLSEIVPAIDMTIIDGPYVSEAHGQGIVIVAESHVWVGVQGSAAICVVFSCRPFSPLIVRAVLKQAFGGHWVTRWTVERSVPPAAGSWWRRAVRRVLSWWCGPTRDGPPG